MLSIHLFHTEVDLGKNGFQGLLQFFANPTVPLAGNSQQNHVLTRPNGGDVEEENLRRIQAPYIHRHFTPQSLSEIWLEIVV
jgi:hypothetical protein